jgi:hypothetical protein
VASFSFLPAPRAHNAPIYFHFYRLKSTNISFWGCEVLRIVLFIRGMWSHVVLLFVAARSSRVLRELALARERKGGRGPFLTSTPPLVGSSRPEILEACGAGACFVAFSTIRFAPSSSSG